jgi:hypothetical protein
MAIQINDKVVIDLTDDSDLKDYFSRKSAGEKCSMEIDATLDEASSDQAVLSITGIQVDEYSAEKTSEPTKKKDVKFKMRNEPEVAEEIEY